MRNDPKIDAIGVIMCAMLSKGSFELSFIIESVTSTLSVCLSSQCLRIIRKHSTETILILFVAPVSCVLLTSDLRVRVREKANERKR